MLLVTTKVDRFQGVGTLNCPVCRRTAYVPGGLSIRFTYSAGAVDLLKVMASLEGRFYVAHRCGVVYVFQCDDCGDDLVVGSQAVKPDTRRAWRRRGGPPIELTSRPPCSNCGGDMSMIGTYLDPMRDLDGDLEPMPSRDPRVPTR